LRIFCMQYQAAYERCGVSTQALGLTEAVCRSAMCCCQLLMTFSVASRRVVSAVRPAAAVSCALLAAVAACVTADTYVMCLFHLHG
jgi:hypothetical protein